MHSIRAFLVLTLLAVTAVPAAAQFDLSNFGAAGFRKRAVRANLVLSHEAARPGDTVMAAVDLTHQPGWHTYWKNPGESGAATELHWALPPGVSAGEIQWPVPEKYVDPTIGLITYVYHDRAVLLVPLKIAPDAPAGTHELRALVKWLECEKICVPGSNTVTASLTIAEEAKPATANADLFAEAERRLPSKNIPGDVLTRWDAPDRAAVRPFVINWGTGATNADFFPFTNALVAISNKTDVLSTTPTNVVLRKHAARTGTAWPETISGLLVREENGSRTGFAATLALGNPPVGSISTAGGGGAESKSFALWLLYAFIGGLILNIMPCVLPVIALKILGFVNQSREEPGHVRTLGLLYTLGVLASFLVLAGIVIGVQAAGQRAGWGMQFGNPQFLVVLTIVITLVALNLFGVFEITFGGRAAGIAGQTAARQGTAGAFMSGVLATVLATPCTAPFLGVALGFAFAQKPEIIALFFATIGLGLALPYLVLSWNPRLLKFLPKPGAWMERFKVAMGFPLLATAVWLFTLTIVHYGKRVWWLGVFLVVLALAAWIYGEFVQRGRARKGIAAFVTLGLLVGGFLYAVERELRWRDPLADAEGSGTIRESPEGIAWGRWSRDAVAEARAAGHPVFVDFTADWCVTCQANKKTSIEIPSVRAKLKEINAVPLLGDYTKLPPAISEELERFGRAGVPLVLVYPADASKPPVVLPELLTPGIVLNALEAAAK